MSRPTYTKRDLVGAAHAWDIGGSLALGLWFSKHKQLCAGDYSALAAAVRHFLQDTTDYSKE